MNTDGKASYLFGLSWYRLFFLNTDSTSDPVDEVPDGKASYLFGLSWYRLFFLNTDSTSDPVDEVTDGKASYLFGLSWYRLFFLNTDSTSDPVDEVTDEKASYLFGLSWYRFFRYLLIWFILGLEPLERYEPPYLSRRPSLLSITLKRSSRLHPVLAQSCCI